MRIDWIWSLDVKAPGRIGRQRGNNKSSSYLIGRQDGVLVQTEDSICEDDVMGGKATAHCLGGERERCGQLLQSQTPRIHPLARMSAPLTVWGPIQSQVEVFQVQYVWMGLARNCWSGVTFSCWVKRRTNRLINSSWRTQRVTLTFFSVWNIIAFL